MRRAKDGLQVILPFFILLCFFSDSWGQEFTMGINGIDQSYIIPTDTLVREIMLTDNIWSSQINPVNIDTLQFIFDFRNADTTKYIFGDFMYGHDLDFSPTDSFQIEIVPFSSSDSIYIGTINVDSQLIDGLCYYDIPGDTLSGFQVILSGENPNNDYKLFIQFRYFTESVSDWRNFQPLNLGNIWRFSGPWPNISETRWEVIDVVGEPTGTLFSIAREQLDGYERVNITYDTLSVRTRTDNLYQIESISPLSYWIAEDFSPYPWGHEGVLVDAIVPSNDGFTQYLRYNMAGSNTWIYGVGFSGGFFEGGGDMTLKGYHVNGNSWGNLGHLVNLDEQLYIPESFKINAYPNPFNPSTTIEYELPEHSDVSLIVYDIAGREVQTLVSRTQAPGTHETSWNGTNQDGKQVAGGMYFARLQAGEYSSVVKMVYLR